MFEHNLKVVKYNSSFSVYDTSRGVGEVPLVYQSARVKRLILFYLESSYIFEIFGSYYSHCYLRTKGHSLVLRLFVYNSSFAEFLESFRGYRKKIVDNRDRREFEDIVWSKFLRRRRVFRGFEKCRYLSKIGVSNDVSNLFLRNVKIDKARGQYVKDLTRLRNRFFGLGSRQSWMRKRKYKLPYYFVYGMQKFVVRNVGFSSRVNFVSWWRWHIFQGMFNRNDCDQRFRVKKKSFALQSYNFLTEGNIVKRFACNDYSFRGFVRKGSLLGTNRVKQVIGVSSGTILCNGSSVGRSIVSDSQVSSIRLFEKIKIYSGVLKSIFRGILRRRRVKSNLFVKMSKEGVKASLKDPSWYYKHFGLRDGHKESCRRMVVKGTPYKFSYKYGFSNNYSRQIWLDTPGSSLEKVSEVLVNNCFLLIKNHLGKRVGYFVWRRGSKDIYVYNLVTGKFYLLGSAFRRRKFNVLNKKLINKGYIFIQDFFWYRRLFGKRNSFYFRTTNTKRYRLKGSESSYPYNVGDFDFKNNVRLGRKGSNVAYVLVQLVDGKTVVKKYRRFKNYSRFDRRTSFREYGLRNNIGIFSRFPIHKRFNKFSRKFKKFNKSGKFTKFNPKSRRFGKPFKSNSWRTSVNTNTRYNKASKSYRYYASSTKKGDFAKYQNNTSADLFYKSNGVGTFKFKNSVKLQNNRIRVKGSNNFGSKNWKGYGRQGRNVTFRAKNSRKFFGRHRGIRYAGRKLTRYIAFKRSRLYRRYVFFRNFSNKYGKLVTGNLSYRRRFNLRSLVKFFEYWRGNRGYVTPLLVKRFSYRMLASVLLGRSGVSLVNMLFSRFGVFKEIVLGNILNKLYDYFIYRRVLLGDREYFNLYYLVNVPPKAPVYLFNRGHASMYRSGNLQLTRGFSRRIGYYHEQTKLDFLKAKKYKRYPKYRRYGIRRQLGNIFYKFLDNRKILKRLVKKFRVLLALKRRGIAISPVYLSLVYLSTLSYSKWCATMGNYVLMDKNLRIVEKDLFSLRKRFKACAANTLNVMRSRRLERKVLSSYALYNCGKRTGVGVKVSVPLEPVVLPKVARYNTEIFVGQSMYFKYLLYSRFYKGIPSRFGKVVKRPFKYKNKQVKRKSLNIKTSRRVNTSMSAFQSKLSSLVLARLVVARRVLRAKYSLYNLLMIILKRDLFYLTRLNVFLELGFLPKENITAALFAQFLCKGLSLGKSMKQLISHFGAIVKVLPTFVGYRVECSGRFMNRPRKQVHRFYGGEAVWSCRNLYVDFALKEVILKYGICGIKVWFYYTECPKQVHTVLREDYTRYADYQFNGITRNLTTLKGLNFGGIGSRKLLSKRSQLKKLERKYKLVNVAA